MAQAELFLLVSSLGGTYKPREDSGPMHRPLKSRSDPESPAQKSRLKPLNISHPSVVLVSLNQTGTPRSGPPSAITTQIILESSRSSPGEPFSPGTTGARLSWEVKEQTQPGWGAEVNSCLGGLEREDDLDYVWNGMEVWSCGF